MHFGDKFMENRKKKKERKKMMRGNAITAALPGR